jgi:hypothetical protein
MLRRCSWCGQNLGQAEPLDDPVVTHGICLSCSERIIGEYREARTARAIDRLTWDDIALEVPATVMLPSGH